MTTTLTQPTGAQETGAQETGAQETGAQPSGPADHRAALTASQQRVLRDIDAGHLSIWRSQDGTDRPDREIAGGAQTWEGLQEQGLIEPPNTPGAWTLTEAGYSIAGRL